MKALLSAALVAAAIAAVAAIVLATSGGDAPARSSPPAAKPARDLPGVRVARLVADPPRAGRPAEGRIVLRAADPDGGAPVAVLEHDWIRTRDGKRVRYRCAEVGPERSVRRYPIRDGGSCVPPGAITRPDDFGLGITSGANAPFLLHGTAPPGVVRLVLAGFGGEVEVPVTRRGSWLVAISSKVRGTGTLTASFRDGTTRTRAVEVPPSYQPPGSVEADDPGGLPAWTNAASERRFGSRRGQTCAQLHQRTSPDGRGGGEFSAPMCGDLRRHPAFVDATAFGPSTERSPFGPSPRAPRRLIVWGAVAADVVEVRVDGPGDPRLLPIGEAGRAFVTVYPPEVRPDDVTVTVTRRDGTQASWRAPRRVNVAPLNARPLRIATPLRARFDQRGDIVLTARLNRRATRFDVTFNGREVTMRPGTRGAYRGSFDPRRGKDRGFRAGRRYWTSMVLCGPGCVTRYARVRLSAR